MILARGRETKKEGTQCDLQITGSYFGMCSAIASYSQYGFSLGLKT